MSLLAEIAEGIAALASLAAFVWAIMVWAPVVHSVYASVTP